MIEYKVTKIKNNLIVIDINRYKFIISYKSLIGIIKIDSHDNYIFYIFENYIKYSITTSCHIRYICNYYRCRMILITKYKFFKLQNKIKVTILWTGRINIKIDTYYITINKNKIVSIYDNECKSVEYMKYKQNGYNSNFLSDCNIKNYILLTITKFNNLLYDTYLRFDKIWNISI